MSKDKINKELNIYNEADMSEEELINFFSHYDNLQLNSFLRIFEYVSIVDLDNIKKAAKKVYNDKYLSFISDMNEEYEQLDDSLNNISRENKRLNTRELIFLNTIVIDAAFFISNMIEITDTNGKHYINDLDAKEVFQLENSILEEIDNRKYSPNQIKIKRLIKE